MGNENKKNLANDAASIRRAERKQAELDAKRKEKRQNIIITVCVIVVAVLILSLVAYNRMVESGTLLRGKIAAETENFEVDGAMMSYFFGINLQNYGSYLSLLGVDTSRSLKDQSYGDATSTWFDYFASTTKEYVEEVLALCEAAKANGMELTEEDLAEIDESIKVLESTAQTYGYTTNQYIAAVFGAGIQVKDIKNCLKLTTLATNYSNEYIESLDYSDEDMQKYYEENKDSFEGIDYLSFTVKSSDFTEEDENDVPLTDALDASAAAKEAADKIAAATSVEEFKSLVKEYLTAHHEDHDGHEEDELDQTVENCYARHILKANIPNVSEWAFESEVGATTVDGNEGATSYTVYYIVKTPYRDETVTRDVRHILLSNETYEDSTKAEEIFAEWEAAGFSDEKFAELEDKYNEDTGSMESGGVYENIAIGEAANEFNAWIYAEDRAVGDKDIVETIYGWHIIEYLSEGDNTAWETNAEVSMRNDDYTALLEEYSEGVNFNDKVIYQIEA